LANWNSGAAPNSLIDSVIIQTGTATFNLPNTTISFLTIDPGAALDIVGGLLNTGGLIDNGTINVDGDPPALVVIGPAIIGSGGTLAPQDGSVTFTNGSLLNAGTLTADFGGSVLINESGINSGIIQAIDGGIVTIENGTMVTNDSNTIGAGHVGNGDGSLRLVSENSGTIDANSCEQALTLDTGCNRITNAGTLAADKGGILNVETSVNNTSGSIKVSDGGFADFEKSVTGGTAVIQGGTLKFDAASSVKVAFDNCDGHYGELILGEVQNFFGTISGFNGQKSECPSLLTSDEIDLRGVAVCNVCFSEDANGNAIIAVKTDGHTITIDNFDFSNLEKASDGQGGTIIFDPPAAATISPSVSIGGAGNDTFVFHPGEGLQTISNFDPQHDAIELDQFANIHNVQELATAITPDVHGNAMIGLGHGDGIAIPGVSSNFLQQNLQNLVHLHA
jgi:hypothetical protein